MRKTNDINDNEIRVIGDNSKPRPRMPWWLLPAVAAGVLTWFLTHSKSTPPPAPAETEPSAVAVTEAKADIWLDNTDTTLAPSVIVSDTVVDSIHLHLYTPYNAVPELHVGPLSTDDTSIILTATAADIRRDNGKIVGAFVLKGQPLSWGLSKKGYCAIIDGRIAIGMADNSPLFEKATEEAGYFFRQYPSVADGEAIANNPENRSYRRALCNLDGQICIICSDSRILMDRFSDALARLGVSDAILLVGGDAEGWYRDTENHVIPMRASQARKSKNVNHIVFRKP